MMQEIPPNRMARFALWLHDRLLGIADRLTRYGVTLPWDEPVEWPPMCTRCGNHVSDRTLPVRITRPSFWSVFVGLEPPWRRRRLDIPVCQNCHQHATRQTRRGRIIPLTVLITILLSGIAIAKWLAPVSPLVSQIIMLAALGSSIGLAIVIGLAIGTPFDITAEKHKSIHFEFRSRDLAQALATANNTLVIEPDPGPNSLTR